MSTESIGLMGSDTPENKGPVARIRAAAESPLTPVVTALAGGLTLVGAVFATFGQSEGGAAFARNNHADLLKWAAFCILLALGAGLVWAFLRSAWVVAFGAFLLLVGVGLAAYAVLETEKGRPRIEASVDQKRILSATVRADALSSGDQLELRVFGYLTRTREELSGEGVIVASSILSPDSSGVAETDLALPVPVGDPPIRSVILDATIADRDPGSCSPSREDEPTPGRACVFVSLPEAASTAAAAAPKR